ncbi:MAG: helicase-exonuclease AddAB subunit AddA [Lachnospiraceae bacterium]|nr:helicase-exonuclease AddAB subunit AddA [Lachnospiraceae bacterium]
MNRFTPEQQKVIDVRDRDVLVSAAAGSGKTTVLVERIIQKISNEEDPCDIDHILVVTFTKAAAKEMREKIRTAIEEKSRNNPTNTHLKKQASYVFHSQITTIDSFCNYIVKNYFYTIGVEPDFRILDNGEYTLMEAEIMDEVLEEAYGTKDPAFIRFADAYGKGNSDQAIANMILSVAKEAMTNPWSMEWLDGLRKPYEISTVEELENSEMVQEILSFAKEKIHSYKTALEPFYHEHTNRGITTSYEKALLGDYEMLKEMDEATGYNELCDCFLRMSFAGFGTGRGKNDLSDFRSEFKVLRDEYKTVLQKDLASYFTASIEDVLSSIATQRQTVEILITMAKKFLEKRHEYLDKMNAWDFSDIEHFALEVLVDPLTKEPREAAIELRDYYDEIMVDEYQDSNYLQEEILRSITGERIDRNNYFMVGDIKQSIYRFRQARPEIFGEKYDTFTTEDSKQQKIELDKNFRSRHQVLEATNEVFMELMSKSVGNVSYNESVSLKTGADYYPNPDDKVYQTEIMIGIKDKEAMSEFEFEDKSELEAVMVANRISDLMKTFQVYDKDLKVQRPIKYSDIVILLRSHSDDQTYTDVLNSRGIPCYAEKSKGYFNSHEVQTVMSFLQILDNPRQDIPLATVLHSNMFGLTNEELSKIRLAYPKDSFYKAVFLYGKEHEEDSKLKSFLDLFTELRSMIDDTPIHVILQKIYEKTEYVTYVYSLPAGELRRGNLYKLIDLAINFETTSFKGLFRFCNYIDKLQKYESDMGEAELLGEEDDVVRIMTIHHSKGLEFPVVFLAGISKSVNLKDASGTMVLHSHKGIALDEISPERRTKKSTLMKKYIEGAIKRDSLGEEMRVLYVAMTRAKEKLILSGTYEAEKIPAPLEGRFTDEMRLKNSGYGGWMLPILLRNESDYLVTTYEAKDLTYSEVMDGLKKDALREDLLNLSELKDDGIYELLSERFQKAYPYQTTYDFKGKYSVSELKHRAMDLNEEKDAVELFSREEKTMPSEPNMGAKKGTAMHRFMECFNFSLLHEENILEKELERVREKKLMSEEDIDLLDEQKLKTFLSSDLAKEMSEAASKKMLLKEQPFVMGDTPKNLLKDLYPEKEFEDGEDVPLVLVQGIIDAFYITEEGMVLVDYKTDRISSGEELIGRYKEQMDLYQKAIEQSYHKKVIKRVLYSFSLGEEVVL